jgi:propionate catabolism regulator PrpR
MALLGKSWRYHASQYPASVLHVDALHDAGRNEYGLSCGIISSTCIICKRGFQCDTFSHSGKRAVASTNMIGGACPLNVRLGIVAPYCELLRLCQETCAEIGEVADIRLGDLAVGVAVAREMEQAGADVIISRGGTALAVERELDVPVVPIEVSPIDVMKALAEARGYGSPIGVVGFKNVVYGIDDMADILGITLIPIEIRSESDVERQIEAAVKLGVRIIVGDAISAKTTAELGVESVLIRSGKEAIRRAIDEAKHVALVRKRERERAEEIKAILDFAHEGIIGTSSDGIIRVFNPVAARILGIRVQDAVGRSIGEVMPDVSIDRLRSSEKAEVAELSRIGQTAVVSSRVPISIKGEVTGAVITFQDVTRIQQLEEKVRKELHAKGHVAQYHFSHILTATKSMKDIIERARRYAQVDSTILIRGETGTGKELFAQSIHNESARSGFPFVAVNCAAVPETLLESELFGYEEGAFTGARRGGKQGLFEQAHRGTLLLDEIGEMSITLQSRLLRVLEEREVMRVGGGRIIPIDVRIIAATHVDLRKAVSAGRFREDLYYRLNKLALNVPPLRCRPADIRVLSGYFLDRCSKKFGRPVKSITREAMDILTSYTWPGNVRELRSIIERLIVCVESDVIDVPHVQSLMHDELHESGTESAGRASSYLPGNLDELERNAIRRALAESGGKKGEAAAALGISRATLWRKLKIMQQE